MGTLIGILNTFYSAAAGVSVGPSPGDGVEWTTGVDIDWTTGVIMEWT